jgi:hypothetical protein
MATKKHKRGQSLCGSNIGEGYKEITGRLGFLSRLDKFQINTEETGTRRTDETEYIVQQRKDEWASLAWATLVKIAFESKPDLVSSNEMWTNVDESH